MSGNDTLGLRENAAMDAVKTMLDEQSDTHTLLIAGAPCSGKTEFALAATLEGISRFGDAQVSMAVSGRQAADKLSDRVIRAVGSTSSARPVTTLSALAFRLLSSVRESEREPLPKLLNGAEQDALLRQVVAVHVRHARTGELCDTCELMRQYFAADDWVDTVYGDDPSEAGGRPRGSVTDQRVSSASTLKEQPRSTSKGIGSSDVLFTRGVNDAFVMQLRDMLARMDELGLGAEREDEVLAMLADLQDSGEEYSLRVERLGIQWRLAFALRREYLQAVSDGYPGEFRLDSSRLLVEGAQAATQVADAVIPKLVVVDDFQDLTLAGLTFLETLAQRGVKLVLVGNPDEAVQTFRGSYPEYLFSRAQQPPLSAESMALPACRIRRVVGISHGSDDGGKSDDSRNLTDKGSVSEPEISQSVGSENNTGTACENGSAASVSYLDLLASRVSLSIAANEDTSVALPDRPGKLPRLAGSLPIAPLDSNDPKLQDSSVKTALYRTPREELDDVVWRIKEAHLASSRQWNDIAVIAHDNDTVRAFGERLRRDGVPVRYSAVTKPLKDDPSVQGLFALLELAGLRHDGIEQTSMSLMQTARYVRSRVQALLESPLVSLRTSSGGAVSQSPARLAPVESVMKAIASLAHVIDGEVSAPLQPSQDMTVGDGLSSQIKSSSENDTDISDASAFADSASTAASSDSQVLNETKDKADRAGIVDVTATLPRLQQEWRELRDRVLAVRKQSGVQVDDSLVNAGADGGGDETGMPLGMDALYIMLAFDIAQQPSEASGSQKHVKTGKKRSSDFDEASGVADEVLELIGKVGGDLYSRAFAHVWRLVGKVEQGLSSLPSREPQYALGLAWDACHVANSWQCQALVNNDEGRAANDRLDVMMRLFAYASGSGAKQSVEDFIASVRSMRIEADSLAKVAPIDQAVTLSTPAGAAGGHWPLVFVTQVQQDVWPNLAERNTMFGGENLAEIVLHGGMGDERQQQAGGIDPELAQVLSAEQKSFLVALTRAGEQVMLSAVLSDDAVPSDFLYTYVPERFDRVRDADPETRDYAQLADSDRFAGLDTDPSGLVAAARIELMHQSDTNTIQADGTDGVNGSSSSGSAGDFTGGNAGGVGDSTSGGSSDARSESDDSCHNKDYSSMFIGTDAQSSARVRDAAVSLALLDDAGLQAADPDTWPYTFGVADEKDSGNAAQNVVGAGSENILGLADENGSVNTAENANNGTVDRDDSQSSVVSGDSITDGSAQISGGNSASDEYHAMTQEALNVDSSAATSLPRTLQNESQSDQPTALPSAPTVTLSPSQVDRIWACPVCWMLESQFAGPRPSNVATNYGSIIHKVAQMASVKGLDSPDFMADHSSDERIAGITSQMMDMYHELADDTDAIDDPEQRYSAEGKDEGAKQTLTDIATYFVNSNDGDYPHGNLKNFSVGRLHRAECEYEFAAKFDVEDIRAAYNAIDGIEPITSAELVAIMGVLNGGWPSGMQPDLQIRLTGRIDRMEWRDLGDGNEHVRLIDWKTGHKHDGKQMFNDLQLVCYQLGLAFPEPNQPTDIEGAASTHLPNAGLRGVDAIKAMPDITQSALFDVDSASSPGQGYGADETLFQPPLFHAGTLNATGFTRRSHYANLQKLADLPDMPTEAPEGVSAQAWQQFLSLRGTQAVWALTMISRIFYAAAASRSKSLVAHPQASHVQYCKMKTVCPACAGEVDTVYEVRRG